MDLIAELKEMGANTEEALARFMNNKALYEKMLLKVPANIENLPVLSFMESGDNDAATANAHTIKGVTGNLSLTPLYNAYTEIVNLLRAGKPDEAKKILVDILDVQEKMISCIKKYC